LIPRDKLGKPHPAVIASQMAVEWKIEILKF
jgi:hypothetical protein